MAEPAANPTAGPSGPWYTRPWVTIAAMYVFLPAGIYHMWRFRRWPGWFKWFSTVLGPALAAVSGYFASAHVWPRIF